MRQRSTIRPDQIQRKYSPIRQRQPSMRQATQVRRRAGRERLEPTHRQRFATLVKNPWGKGEEGVKKGILQPAPEYL
jgi:hypothetical protein